MSPRWRAYWGWQRVKAAWRRWRCAHEWWLPARPAVGWQTLRFASVPMEPGSVVEFEWTNRGGPGLINFDYENVIPRFGVAGGNMVSGEATADSIWLDVAWLRARLRGPDWRPAICRRCGSVLMVEEAKGA